jgi:hypothetical protein
VTIVGDPSAGRWHTRDDVHRSAEQVGEVDAAVSLHLLDEDRDDPLGQVEFSAHVLHA